MKILPNGVAVIEGDSHHGSWCEKEGLVHDKFTAGVIRQAITKYNVTNAVDAGANIGTLTRVMLDAGVQVHAFECNPAALECLRYNCPEAVIRDHGLSDRCEENRFRPLENAGASFAYSVMKPEDIAPDIQVNMATLDAYGIRPGFIKLDVEGYEVKALRGAQCTIQACKPVILCEVNKGALERAGSSDTELRNMLHSYGYRLTVIQHDCAFGDPQFDVLAIPLT